MSFFTLSDGQNVDNTGVMEMGGGDIAPIPKGTNVLAAADEAKIDEYNGERTIKIRWNVLQPEQYKNRKIFQKIKAFDNDSAVRDKALRMLVAIDTNCGGKLVASGQEPNDQSLTATLLNRPMVLGLEVWELDDKSKSGNWVSKVSPRAQQGQQAAQPQVQTQVQPQPMANQDYSPDVPF